MRAATFREYGGPEVMRWEQLDDPACGRDEVIVRVRACGLNHSDLDSRAGSSRWPFTMPWVLGAEFAGSVVAVGAEVEGIADGDPVTAYQQFACGTCAACGRWRPDLCERFVVFGTDRWGGYAELVAVPARTVIPLPTPDDFVTAAAAQCVVSTAWSMVVSVAAVRAGETVLVPSASGGVAGAAVQAARLSGARVIASVGAPEKADAVQALGADVVFCYRDTPVAEATGGRGVDAVIDTTGGPRFGEHLAAMAPDGRLVTCGAHAGEVVPLDIIELFRHGHRILGFRVATPDEIRTSLAMALDGAITVPVDRTFPTAQAAAAHAYMDEQRHVGKIVLVSE
jgi:NADPH:quinone reductase-like Zn-dependent oxidoreductase